MGDACLNKYLAYHFEVSLIGVNTLGAGTVLPCMCRVWECGPCFVVLQSPTIAKGVNLQVNVDWITD